MRWYLLRDIPFGDDGDFQQQRFCDLVNNDLANTIGNLLNRVAGINVIGLRRAGFTAADRAEVKRVVDLLFRSGLNRSQALEAFALEAWGAPAQRFIDFIQAPSKKGIARMHLKMGEADDEE